MCWGVCARAVWGCLCEGKLGRVGASRSVARTEGGVVVYPAHGPAGVSSERQHTLATLARFACGALAIGRAGRVDGRADTASRLWHTQLRRPLGYTVVAHMHAHAHAHAHACTHTQTRADSAAPHAYVLISKTSALFAMKPSMCVSTNSPYDSIIPLRMSRTLLLLIWSAHTRTHAHARTHMWRICQRVRP